MKDIKKDINVLRLKVQQLSLDLQESQRELDALSCEQTKELQWMVGLKVTEVIFYPGGEGIYRLIMENEAEVHFGASGDDMTTVTCEVIAPTPTPSDN